MSLSRRSWVNPTDLDAGTVRVHKGKGNKPRVSGIEEGMAALVLEWVDHRASKRLQGRDREERPRPCRCSAGALISRLAAMR